MCQEPPTLLGGVHFDNHIINRIPSKVLKNKTPYEVLHKQTPDYIIGDKGSRAYRITRVPENSERQSNEGGTTRIRMR